MFVLDVQLTKIATVEGHHESMVQKSLRNVFSNLILCHEGSNEGKNEVQPNTSKVSPVK